MGRRAPRTQERAALVPCYAFGVVDLYGVSAAQHRSNSKGMRWTLSKKFGVAVPSYRRRALPAAPRPCVHPSWRFSLWFFI